MNLSSPFVKRPIAHGAADRRRRAGRHRRLLRAAGVAAAAGRLPGDLGVSASIPGASPDTMATSVATPLERRLGTIAGVNEITSQQRHRLDARQPAVRPEPRHRRRRARGAGRDQRVAASTCRPRCAATRPTARPTRPTRRCIILALTSKTTHAAADLRRGLQHRAADGCRRSRASATSRSAAARCRRCASSCMPFALNNSASATEDVRAAIQAANANRPKGSVEDDGRRLQIYTQTAGAARRPTTRRLVVAWRNGAAVRLRTSPRSSTASRTRARWACSTASRRSSCWSRASPAPTSSTTVDGVRALLPELQAQLPADVDAAGRLRQHQLDPRLAARGRGHAGHLGRRWWCWWSSVFLRSLRATLVPARRDRRVAARHLRRDVPARLQPQQPEPDGADRGHRLRRRRRDRGAGEHQPPHRGRHGPLRGGAARRARRSASRCCRSACR